MNLNTVSQTELTLLPFVNIKTSKAILAYREKHGAFEKSEDIQKIENVPKHILEELAGYSKFDGEHTLKLKNGSSECGPPLQMLENDEFFDSLVDYIGNAEEFIHLSTFIFVPRSSPGNRARRIADALIEAEERGVDVRVYLEKQADRTDSLMKWNRKTGDYLKRGGVEVFVDSPEEKNHFKAALIDKRYLFLGSHNMTSSALKYNNELSVLMDSRKYAQTFLDYLESIDYYRY